MAKKLTRKDRRFEIRTVRNGCVRIAGKVYRPEAHHTPYDGRLEGLRFAFGRYWQIDRYLPFVALWGTEAAFRHDGPDFEYGPECVDGTFPWQFWMCE